MSTGLNEVNLLGNLGVDAEVKHYEESNSTRAVLSLCTEEIVFYKNGKSGKEKDWHRVVLWGEVAKDAKKLKKGDQVYISGKLKHRQYKDETGVTRYYTEIVAHTFIETSDKKTQSNDTFSDDPLKPNNSSNSITYPS